MTTQTHHIVCSILCVVAFALTGCSKNTPQAPPKDQVQDALRASLPPFLSLDSIELEPVPTGPEAVKVNFKAIVTPKEDLYQVEREVEGTPTVTLLTVVQAAGTKVSLYGSVEAHRTMDQWTLESPQIQVGREQFGAPRGAFDAQSYVTGTNEANAALKQQAANAELQERARKAGLEQRERERKALLEQQAREEQTRKEREEQGRIALEEQRKKEEEQRKREDEQRQQEEAAARQELILATRPGTRYSGTITYGDERSRLRLVFTEQKDFVIYAEASEPGNTKHKRIFAQVLGEELLFNQIRERDGSIYPIVMRPLGGENTGLWLASTFGGFYGHTYPLKLRLTDTGLEGESEKPAGGKYTIRLQREGKIGPHEGKKSTTTKGDAPSPIPPDRPRRP